ncbi:tail fiber protein [Xenorhabdus thuongxuanensis]|uniref:Tail protein n=1 Tax=Xenorhabdus thuongxuanensis TaxID=1873484 RepID=A0A1Q5U3P3_9GAMM|nr:phage tail protein [Xenorhabdus thuongxuanensis]OKP07103.1 tail protein [Xenorhabdus thuongxuanensis]
MQDKKPDVIALDDDGLVVVATPEYVKEAIAEHAASRNHPDATLQDKGLVVLSNDTGSDSETMAATPKAVKAAYDLANTANQNTLNNNSNLYLEKKQNGADIPNKPEFISNIGAVSENGGVYPGSFQFQQVETTPKESNPVKIVSAPHQEANKLVAFTNYGWYSNDIQTGIVRGGGVDTLGYAVDINNTRALVVTENAVTTGSIHIRSGNYGGVLSYRDDGTYWRIEGTSDGESILLNFIDRNPDGSNRYVQSLPKGTGTLMSTSQHYIDSSGCVKKNSPIIKFSTDGLFETNSESEGATIEHLSQGTYLIKGVKGFSNDEAVSSIDIPRCQNDLPMVWVNHEVLPDGSIKLMTYHREHSDAPAFARNIREGYANGDLIDIPDGRFVSVRVQMPETK